MGPDADFPAAELAPQAPLKFYESALSDHALFLAPLTDRLVLRWAELYLNVLGRRSFFSAQRVEKLFRELTEVFVACLKEKCLEIYFETLRQKGELFSSLGVPFEEVLLSLHLFEETCLEQFLESYPDRTRLPELLLGLEQLHNEGLSCLAASYFETTKAKLQKLTVSLQEENELLKSELSESKDSFFSKTSKELGSMQLLISGINQKLRNRVYQQSRVQKIADAMDNECHLPKLLSIASRHLLALCPSGSEVFFGLFDEDRTKVNAYAGNSDSSLECAPQLTFYFSELPRQFQDALYDETKKCALLKNAHELPGALVEFGRLKGPRDSLLIPLRRYQKLQGFILITTASQDFFERGNVRFFQRMGQTVSRAVTATLLFTKAEKHEEFTSVIDELKRKKIERQPFERTLDFCLGSLIRLLGAERCSVMVYDPAQKTLKVCAAKGYRVYPIAGSTFKWGEGVAGLALKESKIVSLPRLKDSDKHPWFGRLFAEPGNTEFKLKSLLCVPLFEEAEPLGVINISTINFHKDFEKSDIEMVQQIANRMSNLLRDLR